jgi:hypothetical protein
MAQAMSTPAREYPIFPAALSEVALLDPGEVLASLRERAAALEEAVARMDAELAAGAALPRVVMLENEYGRAMARAELAWVRSLLDDLRGGTLTWTQDEMRRLAARTNPT